MNADWGSLAALVTQQVITYISSDFGLCYLREEL